MSLNTLNRRNIKELRLPKVLISILSTIGIVDTATITLDKFGLFNSSKFCLTSNGCDIVLNSSWGTLLYINKTAIPLSLAGLITYSSLLIISLLLTFNFFSKKSKLNRFFWWLIFLISCGSSSFSLILVFDVMMSKLNTYCTFCIVSAIISFSIFILSIIGAKFESRETIFYRGFIVFLTFLVGGLIWSNNLDTAKKDSINQESNLEVISSEANEARINFAKFLSNNNIIMYSLWHCGWCQKQKEFFGKEALKELTIVECAEQDEYGLNEFCLSKGITSTPTWEIDGELISGAMSLNDLARLTGYTGNTKF